MSLGSPEPSPTARKGELRQKLQGLGGYALILPTFSLSKDPLP